VTLSSARPRSALFHAESVHGVVAPRGFLSFSSRHDFRRALPLQLVSAIAKTTFSPRQSHDHRSNHRMPETIAAHLGRLSDRSSNRTIAQGFLHLEDPFTMNEVLPNIHRPCLSQPFRPSEVFHLGVSTPCFHRISSLGLRRHAKTSLS